MRNVRGFLGFLALVTTAVTIAACDQPAPAPAAKPAAPAALTPAVHGTLADVMRGIPFPNSNIIFDTQTKDPAAAAEAAKKSTDKSSTAAAGGASAVYAGVYGGWTQVENAAIAISETANLIMIPGRKCMNGLPVPLEQENFRKAIDGLVKAGEEALKAAKTKDLDKMVEASGTISDACLACHEKYRDVPEGKMRCVPVP